MKINVAQFVSAVQEVNPFVAPDMNDGTSYLFKNVYGRLSSGDDYVRISELDFNAFDLDDIESLQSLYNDIYMESNYKADCITATLRQIAPVSKIASYI